MCKHVAAVLYGVGVRLDEQPELIFILRGVDPKDLVKQAGSGIAKSAKRRGAGKVLDDAVLSDLFGIEIVDVGQAERAHRSGNKEGSNVTSGRPAKRVAATAAKQAVPRNPEGTKNTADTKTGQREKAATKTPVMLSKVMTVKAGAGRSAEPKAKPATGKPVPVGVSKRKAR